MLALIAVTAYLTILGASSHLIFSKHYDDGLLGRLALAAMALGSVIRLLQSVDSTPSYQPAGIMVLTGVALFLVRHCYRYHTCRKNPANIYMLPDMVVQDRRRCPRWESKSMEKIWHSKRN